MGDSKQKTVISRIFWIIGIIIFFLSFLPYLALPNAAVEGCSEGLFGGCYVYGTEAVRNMLIFLSIIPVYPICLLYELFFYFRYLRKRSPFYTYAIIVTPVIIALSVLVCCIRYNMLEDELIDESKPSIKEYLSDRYGEDLAENISISVGEYDYPRFDISSPVLPEGRTFEVSNDLFGDDLYIDDLMELLLAYNEGMSDSFDLYMDEKLGLPENMHSDSDLLTIDLDGYKNGDDISAFFGTADYRVRNVTVECEDIDDITILAKTSEFGEKWFPLIQDYMYDCVLLDLKYRGDVVARVQVDKPSEERNGMRPIFIVHIYKTFPKESYLDEMVFYLDDMSFAGTIGDL